MDNDTIAAILTLFCALCGLALAGHLLREALKTGRIFYITGSVRADRQPLAFWCHVAVNAAAVMLFAALGVYALWRLAPGA